MGNIVAWQLGGERGDANVKEIKSSALCENGARVPCFVCQRYMYLKDDAATEAKEGPFSYENDLDNHYYDYMP